MRLRHRRLERHALGPPVRLPRRAIDQQARRGQLGGHARELVLHQLEVGERLAELMARARVAQRLVERARRHTARRRADRGAQAIERAEADREPLALLAHAVLDRHAAALELDLAQGMRRREDLRADEA